MLSRTIRRNLLLLCSLIFFTSSLKCMMQQMNRVMSLENATHALIHQPGDKQLEKHWRRHRLHFRIPFGPAQKIAANLMFGRKVCPTGNLRRLTFANLPQSRRFMKTFVQVLNERLENYCQFLRENQPSLHVQIMYQNHIRQHNGKSLPPLLEKAKKLLIDLNKTEEKIDLLTYYLGHFEKELERTKEKIIIEKETTKVITRTKVKPVPCPIVIERRRRIPNENPFSELRRNSRLIREERDTSDIMHEEDEDGRNSNQDGDLFSQCFHNPYNL